MTGRTNAVPTPSAFRNGEAPHGHGAPVLIVGATRLGVALGRRLVAAGEAVTLVGRYRSDRWHAPADSYTRVVVGDPRSPRTWERAGIEAAHAVVAVTDSDTDNLLVALAATQNYSVPLVLALVGEETDALEYRRLGIETVRSDYRAEQVLWDRIVSAARP